VAEYLVTLSGGEDSNKFAVEPHIPDDQDEVPHS
jgi:hypothetical protein